MKTCMGFLNSFSSNTQGKIEKGLLLELSCKTHLTILKGKGREAVHPYGHSQHPDAPVDREFFNKEVSQYWKDRAAEAAK